MRRKKKKKKAHQNAGITAYNYWALLFILIDLRPVQLQMPMSPFYTTELTSIDLSQVHTTDGG